MKMMIAILRDVDSDPVTRALTAGHFRVTRIASTGGLLRRGVTTLLVGMDDEQVEAAIQVLKESCCPAPERERNAPPCLWCQLKGSSRCRRNPFHSPGRVIFRISFICDKWWIR